MIAQMKRFHLFFTGDSSDVFKNLQKEEIVEIDSLPDRFGFLSREIAESEIESNFKKVGFLKGLVKTVEGREASGKILVTREQEREILVNFPLDEIYERFSLAQNESLRRGRIREKILSLREELLPIKELKVIPSDLFSMRNFSFCLFAVPKKQKNVPEQLKGFPVERVGGDNKRSIFLILFPKEMREEILKEIENIRGEILSLKCWNKIPSEIIRKLDAVYEKNALAEDESDKHLKEILSLKNEILVYYDYANTMIYYQKAKEKLKTSRFVAGLAGWVKEKDVPRLTSFIEKTLPESYLHISEPDAGEEKEIPIALENNRFIDPFEVVTDLYGRPVYKSIDPTVHLSFFFAISFAFCIGDAGYGLLLVILSLIFMKKFRFMPGVIKFLRLLLYGGIVTIVVGALTGGWFGDLLNRLPADSAPVRVLNRFVILNPLEGGNQTFIFLGWALIIGYIQILWGLTLNVINSVRQQAGIRKSGEPIVLLLIQVFVAVLLVSFFAIRQNKIPQEFIKVPVLLLILSFIYLMVVKARTQNGAMMKAFWSVYSAYNVIAGNLLGDVLSYSRLFGLGLTSSVLALVVNEMVFMCTNIPFIGIVIGGLLFILGHMGDLVLNIMGGYIHTSRLQYLEFFTKFFEGGGRPFAPLKEPRQYTYIRSGES